MHQVDQPKDAEDGDALDTESNADSNTEDLEGGCANILQISPEA